MSLTKALQWRYATKRMNGQTVPQEKVDKIIHAAHMAPSSVGLQPYKIIVVSNPEMKAKIQPIAFNQAQIVECSHLLIFAAWDNYTEERINENFDRTNRERGLPQSTASETRQFCIDTYTPQAPEINFSDTARQAFISLGFALAEAALLEVDASPMGGFDPAALDALLNLDQLGLKSVVLMGLGYRDEENDWLVKLKKVRTPMENFIIEYK